MIRKFWGILAFVTVLACVFSGCGKGSSKNVKPAKPTEPDYGTSGIFNEAGELIAEVSAESSVTIVDGGLFYCVEPEYSEDTPYGTAYYHFLSFEDGTNKLLGSFETQGYEADYMRTELDGAVYTTVISGDPYDFVADELYLLCFDLKEGTMTTHLITEYGYPYTSVCAAGGKILIMNFEQTESQTDVLYEFDPKSGSVRKVLSFEAGGDSFNSMRAVCKDADGFAVLRLAVFSGEYELFVDRYDDSGNKLSELPVGDLITSVAAEFLTQEDAANELRMLVSHFSIEEGRYMFYENFGMVTAIFDLQELKVLAGRSDLYAISSGNGQKVLYRVDYESLGDYFDAVAVEDGNVREITVTPPESGHCLRCISVSEEGKIMFEFVKKGTFTHHMVVRSFSFK